jgi:hypothetical protein
MRLAIQLGAVLLAFVSSRTAGQTVERVRRIGVVDGDPHYVFARPSQIRELPDRSILVVEGSDAQVRIYDADGRFVRAFGRRGSGPGEFLMPFGIVARDSVLHISDASLRRITTYTRNGHYVADHRMPEWPVTAFSSMSLLKHGFAITASNPSYGSRGVFLDIAVQLLRPNQARVDTLVTYSSGLVLHRDGRNFQSASVRLGEGGAWAASGDSMVVLADARRGIVTWFWVDEDGLREWRRVDLRWRPEPITRADRVEIEQRFRASRTELRTASLDLILPREWGRVNRMLVANDGTAWLSLTNRFEIGSTWLLVAPNRTTRQILLPERFFLWSVTGDRLYGVERDENDVPFVAIYRLAAHESSS